ncbi:MAG: hypothetical protein HYS15_03035 [Candidatus Spechtbacteria bacterium]|nr:hypothetical protein [Candidatus Spechtbacteria bacterium]
MEDEDYRKEFEEVGRLAREVHIYAKEAWCMVGHKPRLFEIRNESVLIDCDKWDKWVHIWTWSGQQPHFLRMQKMQRRAVRLRRTNIRARALYGIHA